MFKRGFGNRLNEAIKPLALTKINNKLKRGGNSTIPLRIIKTLKDIRVASDNFLTKNDRICILNFINENEGLFLGDHLVLQKFNLFHHKTNLVVHVIGAGMLSIEKFVDGGNSYQYRSYVNFLVK